MISERVGAGSAVPIAGTGRRGSVRRTSRAGLTSGSPSWVARLTAAPTIAGRERLAEALGQSVLVQLMLAMTFVAGAFLVYMAQQSQISVQEMNISALQSERTQLVAQNTNLRITATNLQSITRIDAIATSQLHMTKPDIRSAVWITPVVPRVPVLRPAGVDATIAGRKSQPLAWMEHAFHIIRSSL